MRPARQALSLLEILFTLGLLTVILVAFASVYPSAYRLNRKSARSTVGAKTSTAVANELLALPIQDTSFNGGNANLLALGSDRAALTAFVRPRVPHRHSARLHGSPGGSAGNPLWQRFDAFPVVDGAGAGYVLLDRFAIARPGKERHGGGGQGEQSRCALNGASRWWKP